jgi:hypothetical protein
MSGQRRTFLTFVGVAVLAAGMEAGQAQPKVSPPAATAQKPNDEGAPLAPGKLVAPIRGEAELGYTKPVSKNDGKFITTTIKVKNLSKGAIAGLKVDEFWYDKDGNPVAGSPSFRLRKPMQPGEVVEVVLKTAVNTKMNRPQWKFEHANGKIKTTLMPKI